MNCLNWILKDKFAQSRQRKRHCKQSKYSKRTSTGRGRRTWYCKQFSRSAGSSGARSRGILDTFLGDLGFILMIKKTDEKDEKQDQIITEIVTSKVKPETRNQIRDCNSDTVIVQVRNEVGINYNSAILRQFQISTINTLSGWRIWQIRNTEESRSAHKLDD